MADESNRLTSRNAQIDVPKGNIVAGLVAERNIIKIKAFGERGFDFIRIPAQLPGRRIVFLYFGNLTDRRPGQSQSGQIADDTIERWQNAERRHSRDGGNRTNIGEGAAAGIQGQKGSEQHNHKDCLDRDARSLLNGQAAAPRQSKLARDRIKSAHQIGLAP